MARRIRDGADLGCRWLVTETGEDTPHHPNPSYHNMLRTGFLLAYQRPELRRGACAIGAFRHPLLSLRRTTPAATCRVSKLVVLPCYTRGMKLVVAPLAEEPGVC